MYALDLKVNFLLVKTSIMAYGSTPYVEMAPKKNGSHIKVHKWQAWNVCVRLVKGLHEPYQALPSASMGNGYITFAGEYR